MGKRDSSQQDEQRLQKKVVERRTGSEKPEGNAALRALRKRLKRAQRKRRSLVVRRRHAAGKTGGTTETEKPATQA